MRKRLLLLFGLLAGLQLARAGSGYPVTWLDSTGQVVCEGMIGAEAAGSLEYRDATRERPNPLFELIRKKQKLNKKITAAVLAFPFPFGIVGLHRIYMGTKPYIPVVYIATVGGVFGILPFIDFCVLMFDKDFKRYENNGKVFMWIKN